MDHRLCGVIYEFISKVVRYNKSISFDLDFKNFPYYNLQVNIGGICIKLYARLIHLELLQISEIFLKKNLFVNIASLINY